MRCHALNVYLQRWADIFRSKHLMTVWVASWQTIRSRVLPRWHVLQCDPIQCTRETHVLHLFTLDKWCWRETCSLSSNLKLSAYKRCLPTIIFSLSKTRRKDTNLAVLDVELQSLLSMIYTSTNLKAFSLAVKPTLPPIYWVFGARLLRVQRSECDIDQASPFSDDISTFSRSGDLNNRWKFSDCCV